MSNIINMALLLAIILLPIQYGYAGAFFSIPLIAVLAYGLYNDWHHIVNMFHGHEENDDAEEK